MKEKALLFDNDIMASGIMQSDDPAAVKRMGQKVFDFNQELWNEYS